jgi:hypothetical protein
MKKYTVATLMLFGIAQHINAADVTIAPPVGGGFSVKSNDGFTDRFKVTEAGEVYIKTLPENLTNKSLCWNSISGKLSACDKSKKIMIVDANGVVVGQKDPFFVSASSVIADIQGVNVFFGLKPAVINGHKQPGKSIVIKDGSSIWYTSDNCTGPIIPSDSFSYVNYPPQLREITSNNNLLIYAYSGQNSSELLQFQSFRSQSTGASTCQVMSGTIDGWIVDKTFNITTMFSEPFSTIVE